MNKYYAIFRVPTQSSDDWMKSTSADDRKKAMDEMMRGWKAWSDKYKTNIVDSGSPLGKTKTLSKDGIKDTRNDLNYVMVIQAGSHDEAAKMISENPHVQMIPTSSVDVMEIPHMGM